MSIRGQLAFDEYVGIAATMRLVLGLDQNEKLPDETNKEIFCFIQGYLGSVFAADGELQAEESEFTNEWFDQNDSVEENTEHFLIYIPGWLDSLKEIPAFVQAAIDHDRSSGDEATVEILRRLWIIGIYASMADEYADEDEANVVSATCNYLVQAANQQGLQISQEAVTSNNEFEETDSAVEKRIDHQPNHPI